MHASTSPLSHPRITWDAPNTKLKGLFLSKEESNFVPSSKVP